MKICVASAHLQCYRSQLWRELQWQFLKSTTTSEFEYFIVANDINPELFKEHATGVLHLPKSTHSTCIQEILGLFQTRDCTHFLLLDSDCWPIREGWDKLLAIHFDKYRFAAPIRTENLDIFPHPSAVFFPRDSLPLLNFGLAQMTSLLGAESVEIPVTITDFLPLDQKINKSSVLELDKCYPLMKTNYISPHPVFASIYGDCFYHHCAGSREIGIQHRLRCANYYQHIISHQQQKKICNKITQQLEQAPQKFINELRGIHSRVANSAINI